MSDETTIEPALSAGEWAKLGTLRLLSRGEWPDEAPALDADDACSVIALANAALPESDPRKITRERLDNALSTLGQDDCTIDEWRSATIFLSALASYLPPEGA